MVIRCKDLFLEPLTAELVKAETFYMKEYVEKGVLQKTEIFMGPTIIRATCYKVSETDQEIIAQFLDIETLESINMREREAYGNYTIENECIYWGNKESGEYELQTFKDRWLYNVEGENIGKEYTNSAFEPDHPEHRVIVKTGFIDKVSPATVEYHRPYFSLVFDENLKFTYLYVNLDPSLPFDDDALKLEAPEARDWLAKSGVTENLQEWYLNSEFLPCIK